MKRNICLLLLLLIFSAATAEPIPFNAGNDYDAACEYADMLAGQFGVIILIGDECLAEEGAGSQYPSASPLPSPSGSRDTVTELKKLERAMAQYPDGFFLSLRNDYAAEGIRIMLVGQMINDEGIVRGQTCYEAPYYTIQLGYSSFTQSTVHHEIWHILEQIILWGNPNAFSAWDDLNPDGFAYNSEPHEEYDPDYFVRVYGTADAEEDRATVAEAVFYENAAEWFAEYPAVKKKLDVMNRELMMTVGIRYNVNGDNKVYYISGSNEYLAE